MTALVFFRVFYFFKFFIGRSPYLSPFSKAIARKYGFSANVRFVIKSNFVQQPLISFTVVFFASILIFAYVIRIFENPYYLWMNKNNSEELILPYNSYVWYVCVVIFTVGYGDITPKTLMGQLVTVCLSFWSAFLISLLVVTLTNIFQLDSFQMQAQREIQMTKSASQVILSSIRFFIKKKKYFLQRLSVDPSLEHNSEFLRIIKDIGKKRQFVPEGCILHTIQNSTGTSSLSKKDTTTVKKDLA